MSIRDLLVSTSSVLILSCCGLFFVWVIEDPKSGPQASLRDTLSTDMSSHIKMYLLSNNDFELYNFFKVHYAQAAP